MLPSATVLSNVSLIFVTPNYKVKTIFAQEQQCLWQMSEQNVKLKARLILYHRGKILLLKQTQPQGGNYTLVGGTIESSEFARRALIRESFEEAGILLKEQDLRLVHVMHKIKKGEHRLIFYFKAIEWEGNLRAKEKHKFKKAEWFDSTNLPENLTETVAHVLELYRHGILYSEVWQ